MKLEKKDKILFISIKPKYINKILNGTKTIELRKSAPKVLENTTIIMYSTSPVMSIVGISKIKKIISAPPLEIWNCYNEELGIEKDLYFDYFQDKEIAVAILLKDISKLEKTISLSKLREILPNFNPPQSYRYLEKKELNQLNILNEI